MTAQLLCDRCSRHLYPDSGDGYYRITITRTAWGKNSEVIKVRDLCIDCKILEIKE